MQRCCGCMREFGKEYDVCPYCGYVVGTEPEIKSHLFPGTKLAGRYVLGKAIGHGGFGITYIAWDDKIQKAVATKEYFPNAFSTRSAGETQVSCYNAKSEAFLKEGIKKMLDEAKRLSKFSNNENIVDIFDFFEENNTAYIVMEYLEGKDLKKVIEENGGKLDPEKAVKIILPVINALEDMHKENFIHRDVSPDNIFLCDNGKIKLLDFGSARLAVEDSDKSLSVMVKRGYAPKEQYASRSKQGPWTDVYAVCATLYKMITGELPVESTEREDEPLQKFSEFGIIGYDELEKVVFKGLEVEYKNRTQTVSELKKELTESAKKKSVTVSSASKKVKVTPKKSPKINVKAIIAAAAVIAVIIGGVFGIKTVKEKITAKTADPSSSTTETTINPEAVHKIYESFLETAEAKKYFEVSNAFNKYYNDFEEYNSYVNSIKGIDKSTSYFDLDGDGTDECILSVCFYAEALDHYVYYIFDVDGEAVRCVDSATELYGDHRSLCKLQIYQNNGEYFIRKYIHDPHIRHGSVYKYNGKTLDFVESIYVSDFIDENSISYENWMHIYSDKYDLYNQNAANYLEYPGKNYSDFVADYNIKELSEEEHSGIIDGYDKNEVYHIPKNIEPSQETVNIADSNEWKYAYVELLRTIEREVSYKFYLGYVDDDEIPELFVSEGWAHPDGVEVYSYNESGVVLLCSDGSNGSINYIERKGYLCGEYEGMGERMCCVYEVKNGTAEIVYSSYDDSGNGGSNLTINDAAVSEKEMQEFYDEFYGENVNSFGGDYGYYGHEPTEGNYQKYIVEFDS